MQFLKLGDSTFLRSALIAGVTFSADGTAEVSMAGGGESVRIAADEAVELLRWLESNASEVSAEDHQSGRGVYV